MHAQQGRVHLLQHFTGRCSTLQSKGIVLFLVFCKIFSKKIQLTELTDENKTLIQKTRNIFSCLNSLTDLFECCYHWAGGAVTWKAAWSKYINPLTILGHIKKQTQKPPSLYKEKSVELWAQHLWGGREGKCCAFLCQAKHPPRTPPLGTRGLYFRVAAKPQRAKQVLLRVRAKVQNYSKSTKLFQELSKRSQQMKRLHNQWTDFQYLSAWCWQFFIFSWN